MKKILVIIVLLFTNSFGMEREHSADLARLLKREGVRVKSLDLPSLLKSWIIREVYSDYERFKVANFFDSSEQKIISLGQIQDISLDGAANFGREKYTEEEFIQLMGAFSIIQNRVAQINWSGKIARPSIFFSALRKFKGLERLFLYKTDLDHISENEFQGLDNLRILNVSDNKKLSGLPRSLCTLPWIEVIMWGEEEYYSRLGLEKDKRLGAPDDGCIIG